MILKTKNIYRHLEISFTPWENFQKVRGDKTSEIIRATELGEDDNGRSPGIGTPADLSEHIHEFQSAGVDQVILMQQAGKNPHAEICESLELFGKEVLPEFKATADAREAKKHEELAPYIEAAMKRKKKMPALADNEIPVVKASVRK